MKFSVVKVWVSIGILFISKLGVNISKNSHNLLRFKIEIYNHSHTHTNLFKYLQPKIFMCVESRVLSSHDTVKCDVEADPAERQV